MGTGMAERGERVFHGNKDLGENHGNFHKKLVLPFTCYQLLCQMNYIIFMLAHYYVFISGFSVLIVCFVIQYFSTFRRLLLWFVTND